MQKDTNVLTESITQTTNLPNVHIVGAHGAGSCNIFASAQSSSPADAASNILAAEVVSGSVTSPAVKAPVGLALDSPGASGAGRKIS